jgi:hypothetical protein
MGECFLTHEYAKRLRICLESNTRELRLGQGSNGPLDADAERIRARAIDENETWLLTELIHDDMDMAWRVGIQMLRNAANISQLWAAGTLVFEEVLASGDGGILREALRQMRNDVRFRVALNAVAFERLPMHIVAALLKECESLNV